MAVDLCWTHDIAITQLACSTGIAGLQAAVQTPQHILGVQLQNVSLRMLHKKRQSAIQRPFVKALQTSLRTTLLGKLFFSQIATKKVGMSAQHGVKRSCILLHMQALVSSLQRTLTVE